MLSQKFFNRDTITVAKELLGKVICVRHHDSWLQVQIIETEAYYLEEKGSHASLGFTEKRKPLFMSAGTIYMYYARGGDSLNVSTQGSGNAVLIKSGIPYGDDSNMIKLMQQLNPRKHLAQPREKMQLCAGQTLLCKALGLKVPQWNGKQFTKQHFYFTDIGYRPEKIVQTTRLGIPKGRDEHLQYRYIDFAYAKYCTNNPLSKRNWSEDQEYFIMTLTDNL